MKERPIIGITMGDPAGIGPEVVLKLFSTNCDKILDFVTPVVIGDQAYIEKISKPLSYSVDFVGIDKDFKKEKLSKEKKVWFLDLKNINSNIPLGQPSKEGGYASANYIIVATKLAIEHKIDALTTAPISKDAINLAGFHYAGHTEMLGDLTQTDDFAMMLWGGDLKVALATTHFALKDVSKEIKKEKISKLISLTDSFFYKWLGIRVKIGIAALNPHGGENGLFGKEEIEEIIPAVESMKRNRINVEGPFPADSLFSVEKVKNFDVIIVMYHDQGLIPIKMKAFGNAVNITMGLPFIRTSVDHGTAYDIVGKGIATADSLYTAIITASALHSKDRSIIEKSKLFTNCPLFI